MAIATRLVYLPLSLLLVACAPTTASNDTGAHPTIPSRSSPSQAEAPERLAAMPASRETAGVAAHCRADEHTVFSCRLTGRGEVVSLCLSRQDDRARYVAGSARGPELAHSGPFQRTSLAYAGGTGGYAYSFERGGQTRALYSISGDEQLARHGQLVIENDPTLPVIDEPCDHGSLVETDDLAVLKRVRSWPPHAQIESHGLPQPKP